MFLSMAVSSLNATTNWLPLLPNSILTLFSSFCIFPVLSITLLLKSSAMSSIRPDPQTPFAFASPIVEYSVRPLLIQRALLLRSSLVRRTLPPHLQKLGPPNKSTTRGTYHSRVLPHHWFRRR